MAHRVIPCSLLRQMAYGAAAASMLMVGDAQHAAAQSGQCIEEAGGVCLKYAPKAKPKAAPKAKTRPQSSAAAAERGLDLTRAERREIQEGLNSLGAYRGAVDGLFGKGTRTAIGAWQAGIGARRTGYLTADQARTLMTARRTRPVAPATPAKPKAAPKQVEAPKPAATAPSAPAAARKMKGRASTVLGTPIKVKFTPNSATGGELRVVMTGTSYRVNNACSIRIDESFSCALIGAAGNRWSATGKLPNIRIVGYSANSGQEIYTVRLK